jgi:uncharacterized Fe-S cluster-containing radical SAM superfamily enzyme
MVEPSYLVEWVKKVIRLKGKVHAFLDSVGEVFTHPNFIGTLLNEEIIEELAELKVERINLSMHSMDEELNRVLTGYKNYQTGKILEIIEYINKSGIDVTLTPVWVPGMNDDSLHEIIEFSKSKVHNRIYPSIAIQKYESHKYGRKPPGVKPMSWEQFFSELKKLEETHKIKLKLSLEDFGIKKTNRIPYAFRIGEKANVIIAADGWMKNEKIGVAKDRSITIVNCKENVGKVKSVRILRNKDNIYIAR